MSSTTSSVTLSNFTGLDFNTILQSVMSAAQVPLDDLQNQLVGVNTAISTLGTIGGDFTSLQSALSTLNDSASIPPVAATASQNAPFTVAVSGGPLAGTYSVNVSQLAAAQSSASQGYASDTSTVGTGTITVTINGNAYTVSINASNDTLDAVATAINDTANIGVTAQVVNTGLPGAPYRLALTSNATGAAQAFTVSSNLSGGTAPDFTDTEVGPTSADSISGTSTPTVGGVYTGSLSQGYHFAVTSGGTVGTDPITIQYSSDSGEQGQFIVPANYASGDSVSVADGLTLSLGNGTLNTGDTFSAATFVPQVSAAQDAQVQVGSQILSSSSNAVTNAVPGLTLNLNGTGGPASVTVAPDVTTQGNQINAFVTAYNTLINDITTNTQALPGQPAPALAGDGGLRAALFNLQNQLGTINLSELGITVNQKTGDLSFSQSAFASAQSADPTAVSQAVSNLYSAFNPIVSDALTPNTGLIATETNSDQTQVTDLNNQMSTLSSQLQNEQNQLQAEYAQIQSQVSNYQSISQLFTDTSSSSNSSSGSSTPLPGSGLTIDT